jgi:ABC-type oligopeptide transport system substrate-binding subunit
VAAFSFLSCTACHRAETDVEKGTRLQILHKGNGQEVQDLDPQIVNSVSSLNIISALPEGLFRRTFAICVPSQTRRRL